METGINKTGKEIYIVKEYDNKTGHRETSLVTMNYDEMTNFVEGRVLSYGESIYVEVWKSGSCDYIGRYNYSFINWNVKTWKWFWNHG